MNLKLYSELQSLAHKVAEINGSKLISNSFLDIERNWLDAVMYNKRQNELIKHNFCNETVKTFHCLDEDVHDLVYIGIKPVNYKLNRKQWFSLLIADEQSLTRQQIKILLKNYKA